jgi:hypothetical protein
MQVVWKDKIDSDWQQNYPTRPPPLLEVELNGMAPWAREDEPANMLPNNNIKIALDVNYCTPTSSELKVTTETLSEGGFGGWWCPTDASVAWITCASTRIPIIVTTPWDGAPDGRVGTVIRNTPRLCQPLLVDLFRDYNPLHSVLGEVRRSLGGWGSRLDKTKMAKAMVHGVYEPKILLGRFRDNCYVSFISMPPELEEGAKHAVYCFLQTVFKMPMKWEPHPSPKEVTWCESSITIQSHGLSLRRKGVAQQNNHLQEGTEWERWVSVGSPNASFTLQSMLPSLLLKSIWNATNITDVIANFTSILRGIGWHGYPRQWWRMCVLRFLGKHSLQDVITFHDITKWVREGKTLRNLPGRG